MKKAKEYTRTVANGLRGKWREQRQKKIAGGGTTFNDLWRITKGGTHKLTTV